MPSVVKWVCVVRGHRWLPYGPPPRYRDYLPHVERCHRCGRHRYANGDKIPRGLEGLLPYPPDEGRGRGWTATTPANDG